MAEKIALVTGANKGIGLEIARQLGKEGATVLVGARDTQKGQAAVDALKAEGINAHAVKLEVTDTNDVAALPAFIESNFGRLDILVNNAGVLPDADGELTPESFRKGYEANVIAPYFLTQTLLPLLRKSPAGRIVNHSSALGSLTVNASGLPNDWLLPVYNSSKAALNMLTVIQAQLLRDTAIKVNAAHPGSVKTDMNKAGDLTVEEGAKTAVRLALLPDDGPTGGFFHGDENLPW